ncbi:MAG: hypothetical protein CMK96_06315 [Pseudomonas sp.]|nr:hypothetical protein [Pseudomonas sp.]QDP67276.1 MAG: hypothetical protein GOVbin7368_67 [Prokaryotic dsDNA virus sp.]|tara:strand:+ start:2657 stop:3025 length:369 start_codon:yes stop_codon:yes gene_type:complete
MVAGMTGWAVTLPWFPRDLSPNSRAHWRTKAAAAAKYKADCQYAAMAAGIRQLPAAALHVSLTFHPPRNAGDLDNMLAAMKSGLDGIAAASGVDDRHWSITIKRGAKQKGGAVHVEITEATA